MNLDLSITDIGLFMAFLFFSYAVLEYIEKREKYSIFLGGNFLLAFTFYVLLKVPILRSFGLGLAAVIASIALYILLNFGSEDKKVETKFKTKPLVLKVVKGEAIKYFSPTENFLVYGGAGAGKTASIGKPLLLQFLDYGYSSFVYDAKEFDYSKTIYGYYHRNKPNSKLYYANFNDVNKSHSFNPIKPSLYSNSTQFEEVNEQFLRSLNGVNKQPTDWFDAALGLYKGLSWAFFKYYPEICTIPHITNFFLHRNSEDLMKMLKIDNKAYGYASAIFKGQDSERTIGSVMFTLSNYLSKIANNENICYILSGDDFDFNFVDPKNPISFCLCNSHQISDTLSPIMGALVNISAKQFTLNNTNPLLYCFDEATTFEIPNFEKLPSLLREFNVAFLMLTQSASKLEKMYGKLDLNSIHSNFTNKYFGKTGDVNAAQMYQQLFQRVMESYTSTSESFGKSFSESETISKRKEYKYETNFFSQLQPGEFVGVCGSSNYTEFHKKFALYDKSLDMEPTLVRQNYMSNTELENYHNQIIEEVKSITF